MGPVVTDSALSAPKSEGDAQLRSALLRDPRFLTTGAATQSEALWSLMAAGHPTANLVGGMLRERVPYAARQPLANAAGDFAAWLVASGSRDRMTVITACDGPRVVIVLIDDGSAKPDTHTSRTDTALIHRVLGHGVIRWECEPYDEGRRATHLYCDTTTPETSTGRPA